MSKKNNTKKAEAPIANIPTHLAIKAHDQWQTIRHAQLIQRLTEFRVGVEAEAGIGIANIETNLGLALADVAEALGIEEHSDLLQILGGGTYLAVYKDPIPYQIATPPPHKARLLLAKLQEIEEWITTKRKTRARAKAKPSPSLPA